MTNQIANWDATGWRETMESLGNPEFHHIYLKDKSLHPFREVSLMLDGKSRLVFRDEIDNIKVGDLVYVYRDGRALWVSGWVTSKKGRVVDLENLSRDFPEPLQQVGPSEHK